MKDRGIEVALVGIWGGGAGAAFVALFNTGFQSNDVFAFSGAIVGAAAAVWGAAWVSDRQARNAREAEKRILIDEIAALQKVCHSAIAAAPDDGGKWSPNYRTAIIGTAQHVFETSQIIAQAIKSAVTLNFRQRADLIRLQAALLASNSFYHDSFEVEEDLYPLDERTWPTTFENIMFMSAASLGSLTA